MPQNNPVRKEILILLSAGNPVRSSVRWYNLRCAPHKQFLTLIIGPSAQRSFAPIVLRPGLFVRYLWPASRVAGTDQDSYREVFEAVAQGLGSGWIGAAFTPFILTFVTSQVAPHYLPSKFLRNKIPRTGTSIGLPTQNSKVNFYATICQVLGPLRKEISNSA